MVMSDMSIVIQLYAKTTYVAYAPHALRLRGIQLFSFPAPIRAYSVQQHRAEHRLIVHMERGRYFFLQNQLFFQISKQNLK